MGGRDEDLKGKIANALLENGFTLETPPSGLEGMDRQNIVNKTKSGRGVQIEISRALRDALASAEIMESLTSTIRQAVASVYQKSGHGGTEYVRLESKLI